MSDRCPAIEELEALLALPAADPRRRHVDACARCRSLADMLGEFAAGATAPAAAGFAAADASMRETIAELTGVPMDEPTLAAPEAPQLSEAPESTATPVRESRRPPTVPWWNFGTLRPAFAFAALFVFTFAAIVLWRAIPGAPVMRDASGAGAGAFAAMSAKPVAGGLELAWSAEPGVDNYCVVFLDGGLREIARTSPVAETRLKLESSALPDGLAHGAEVAWYVEARAGEDVVARTATRTLRVP